MGRNWTPTSVDGNRLTSCFSRRVLKQTMIREISSVGEEREDFGGEDDVDARD